MDGFTTVVSSILEVGLAPVLVVLLLWKGFDLLNKYNRRLYEIKLALYLILDKLEATQEYEDALRELKAREKNGD